MKEKKRYPNLYLAIDNCFAYKRWTEPESWAKVISELGIRYVEASADTELDPLYMGREYLKNWIARVKEAESTFNVKVVNLYSGHGTYSTLGLAHTDAQVRRRMEEEWFWPMIETAGNLNAGMGFFAHGFSESVMQDKVRYQDCTKKLIEALERLAVYAEEQGCRSLALEQMYVPYMIPWTIKGTKDLLKTIKRNTGKNFYFTEDLGHHHRKFRKPGEEQIRRAFERGDKDIWLGPDKAFRLYDLALERGELSGEVLDEIKKLMEEYSYFFAESRDGDCYEWLKELGGYSPIIHLQQTDGVTSAHKPFSEAENQWGIVEGKKVLKAIKESYDKALESEMPERCEKIYLTLELFSGTTQTSREILENYRQSVAYWRKFIPKDGMNLEELVD